MQTTLTCRDPWPHMVISNFFYLKEARAVLAELPIPEWEGWVHYTNDCERKRSTRELEKVGRRTQAMFDHLNGPTILDLMRGLAGTDDLHPDPSLHGAGIHVADTGGYLQCHLDYALHPESGLERRLNLVLFLNETWRAEWGGAFELCDQMGKVVKRIVPEFCTAVIWEPSDVAYHGTEIVRGDVPRITAAVYYLAPPRPGAVRKRALYVPRR